MLYNWCVALLMLELVDCHQPCIRAKASAGPFFLPPCPVWLYVTHVSCCHEYCIIPLMVAYASLCATRVLLSTS